jgi:hypothetical protein
MAQKRKTDLASLVQDAGNEIAPIQRGRGLAGMLTENPPAADAQDMSLSTHDDISTSKYDDKQESLHADAMPMPAAEPLRRVKSYRIRDDLAYQIDVLAAQQRRKVYELVEEALTAYLRQANDSAEQQP